MKVYIVIRSVTDIQMNEKLSRHDMTSLLLHAAVKEKLMADSETVIATAQANLIRWKASYGFEPRWMGEWFIILEDGINRILPVLEGVDDHSVLLRSNSPFTGILSENERMKVLKQQEESESGQ